MTAIDGGSEVGGEVEDLLRAVGTTVLAQDDGTPFGDLGVDSLARMEISKRVQDRYGGDIEDLLTEDTTPAALRKIINRLAGRRPIARTENHVEIAAPIGYVWAAVNDVRRWTELFTEYASVEVLAEGENWVTFRLTLHPDANGVSWSWVSRRRWNRDKWTVRAWRIERGNFEFMRLRWSFEQLAPDRTRMTWAQEFRMKPTAPLDDAAMVQRINTGSAVQMEIIARRIEERRRTVRTWDTTSSVRKRGGDMRTLIGPAACGSAYGISGFVELAPGERIDEHLHPYSEEHLLIVSGQAEIDLEDTPVPLQAKQGVLVPRNVRHRLRNTGDVPLVAVFALSPLAPRPELGHVDTESGGR
ncbi:cupin domain-containing protein [Lentzea nigeriaca]|uniref:cupin domain-containing protein n=1 Tax=Lentzea nigeriaca TaxID=1128665 RepID=UPI001957BFE1|nr:cupin domain-containing protein [Lentzea nigeriaca]MBM7858604.1 aromatase [Lentzea nigeriaca]